MFTSNSPRPLADRLRPQSFDDVVGQEHLLGAGKPLTRLIESGRIQSIILWGPPGTGKTTIANLLAKAVKIEFESVSAILSGVADIRKIFERAEERHRYGQQTMLFVDEIHRFNRAQQDVFLSHIEDGSIILIGATTQNPSFELTGALISRCRVMTINRLDEDNLEILLQRAEKLEDKKLPLTDEARALLIRLADGDGRAMLNYAEALFAYPSKPQLDPEGLLAAVERRAPLYDKKQEGHYNLISALHKSIRGSDPDAALYWLARMLDAGEEPLYILRRLIRAASEDVGLADPMALLQANAAKDVYHFLGSPEGELAIAQCVIYLATAPKSNATYVGYGKARKLAQEAGSLMPPKHILNAPTQLMRSIGYSKGYVYDHETEEEFSGQDYFPEGMKRSTLYDPKGRGFEGEVKKRLDYWQKLRQKSQNH
jgi:putative ATPase